MTTHRIERADPTEPPRYDAQGRRLCHAHRKDGTPCSAPAMHGQRICKLHGGNSPQAKRRARLRLMELVDPAVTQLARILADPNASDRDVLRAAESVLDRTGYAKGYEVTLEDARMMLAERLERAHEGTP